MTIKELYVYGGIASFIVLTPLWWAMYCKPGDDSDYYSMVIAGLWCAAIWFIFVPMYVLYWTFRYFGVGRR